MATLLGINLGLPERFDDKAALAQSLKDASALNQVRGVRMQCELGSLLSEDELKLGRVKIGSFGGRVLDSIIGAVEAKRWGLIWTLSRSSKVGKTTLTDIAKYAVNNEASMKVGQYLNSRLGELFTTLDNEPPEHGDKGKAMDLASDREILREELRDAGIKTLAFCRHGAFDGKTIQEECRLAMARDYQVLTSTPWLTQAEDARHVYIDPAWGIVAETLAKRTANFEANPVTEFGIRERIGTKRVSHLDWGRAMGRMANHFRAINVPLAMAYCWNKHLEFSFTDVNGKPIADRVKGWNEVVAA